MKSVLLLPVLLSTSSAYFAQVNNAHVEFVAAEQTNHDSTAETVDDRSSLQHSPTSLWTALESALEEKSELGYAAPKIMSLFDDWVEEFGREYRDVEEKSKRLLVWLENHVLIETHNAKKSSFTMGHNSFSDMTNAEFREHMKLDAALIMGEGEKEFNFVEFSDVDDEEEEEGEVDVSNSRLRGPEDAAVERKLRKDKKKRKHKNKKDEKDWQKEGLMGPIRNQGVCGACWAFSAVGAIESAIAIDTFNQMTPPEQTQLLNKVGVDESSGVVNDLGLVIPLSEQDIIDCDTAHEHGCMGGLMTTTFDEEEHRQGICSEEDYPYLMAEGTCASDSCTPVPGSIVKDHVDVVPRKTNQLKEALMVKPVTAAMAAGDPMFQFYKTGIFSTEGCGKVTRKMGQPGCNIMYPDQDTCLPDINHGVLVVGYGTDESATTDPKGYFKVKNSWGEAWGEKGYFRLARWEEDKTDPTENWGECAILTLLSYPVMEK